MKHIDNTPVSHVADLPSGRDVEARLRGLIEALPCMAFESDTQGARTWSSERWLCYTGLEHAQLAAQGWRQAVHPQDLPAGQAAWTSGLYGGAGFEARWRIRRHDGAWRWHLVRAVPLPGMGVGEAWSGSATDIDDLVQAEAVRAAQEQQARFMLTLNERLRDLADPQAMMNAATAALGTQLNVAQVGYGEIDAAQEHVIIHRDWNDGRIPSIVGTWRMDDFGPAFIKEMKTGQTIVIPDVTLDARTSAPEVVAAYDGIHTRSILDVPLVKQGRMVVMLFIHHAAPRAWTPAEVALVEETCERLWAAVERARAERALADKEVSLRAAAQAHELERRRAEDLAELDRAKTEFFSNISHEFRTPLTLMLAPLEDMLHDANAPLGETQYQRADTALRNALRLQKLVNALLNFARIEAGRAQAQFVPTDLARLTVEAASMFEPLARPAGLELVVACPPLPQAVYVDAELWERIVLNLVSNAFKFTFKGRITVRLSWQDDQAVLAVSDTGTGIAPKYLSQLFERFHRVPQARGRSFEGSGIGLALVQELVRLHGGQVQVQSTLGQGSTFTVTVPAGRAHLPADQVGAPVPRPVADRAEARAFVEEVRQWVVPPGDAPGQAEAGAANATRPRIVLADDNADMRRYIQSLLAGACDVEAVADGAQALEAVRRECPDLVLCDVMMPVLDGFGLLRALRDDDRTRTLPVILISARAGEESRAEGLEAGAIDYLVKPFTARELQARVMTQLDMTRLRREAEDSRRALEGAAARQAADERLLYHTEAAGVGTWDCDLDSGRFICSPRCRDILGLPSVQLDHAAFLAALHPQDQPRAEAALREAAAQSQALSFMGRTQSGDGSEHWVQLKGRVSASTNGHGHRLGGVVIDITEHRAALREIRRLNAELELRVAERTAELEAANKELDAFTYAVSHDLRGPLRGMRGFAQALMRRHAGRLEGDALAYLQEIDVAGKEMAELVEGLLALSRSSRGTLHCEPVNLSVLAEALRGDLQRGEPGREVAWYIEPGLTAWGDLRLLETVLRNLLDNAWKYTGRTPQPSIRLDVQERDGQRWFCVSDNGAGFDMRHAQRLFNPFERLHREEEFKGTGVGLATVQRILHRHGGCIEAESAPGRGASFRFTLPSAPPGAGEEP